MSARTVTLSYDSAEQIMFVGLADLTLNTKAEIAEVFDAIRAFWRGHCARRKVYAVIDYTNFVLNMAHADTFAACVKQAVEQYAITAIRHTDDVLARTTIRVVNMRIHHPSNLYATREQAIEVVRAIRAKRITIDQHA